MRIRATTERMVYQVESEEKPKQPGQPRKWYRVDLLANNGATFCSCKDFGTRMQKNIDAGLLPLVPRKADEPRGQTTATICKHGHGVLLEFNRGLLPAMASQENQPERDRE